VLRAAWQAMQPGIVAKAGKDLDITALDISDVSKAEDIVAEGIDFLKSAITAFSVGFNEERYQYRIRVEKIDTRLRTQDQEVRLVSNFLQAGKP